MKSFFVLLVVVGLVSCGGLEQAGTPVPAPASMQDHNSAQAKRLLQLCARAGADISKATDEFHVNDLSEKYSTLIHNYLTDSCGSMIDSIEVKVEKVAPSGSMVFASFSKDAIHFYASLPGHYERNTAANDIYRFVNRLTVQSDTVMKFVYLGECEVGFYKDAFDVNIKAAPVPPSLAVNKGLISQLAVIE